MGAARITFGNKQREIELAPDDGFFRSFLLRVEGVRVETGQIFKESKKGMEECVVEEQADLENEIRFLVHLGYI